MYLFLFEDDVNYDYALFMHMPDSGLVGIILFHNYHLCPCVKIKWTLIYAQRALILLLNILGPGPMGLTKLHTGDGKTVIAQASICT
jgi:hypothetical protein